MVKNPPADTGDIGEVGLIPGLGRSPGGGHGLPLQHSCREESHGQTILAVRVHGVAESDTPVET